MDLKNKLYEYLEDCKEDNATKLTMKKVMDRASNFIEKNKMLYFTVERHRGLLGAQYTKGLGMNAFETKDVIYCFNPLNNEIFEISSSITDREINYALLAEEHLQDFSISLTPLEHDKYLLEVSLSCIKTEVSSFEEALEILKNNIDDWDLEHYHDELELVTESEKNEFDTTLREAYHDCCRKKLESEWEDATDCK